MGALPVAVVYVDVQVMALRLRDGGVRDRLGDFGQAGTALLGGQACEQGGVPCGEGAWLPPRLGEISEAYVFICRVGEAHAPFGLACLGYRPL